MLPATLLLTYVGSLLRLIMVLAAAAGAEEANPSQRNVGLVVLGDSGVGKTWLIRLLMGVFDDGLHVEQEGQEILVSKMSTSSVTQKTEVREYDGQDGENNGAAVKIRLYNVPGLGEHKTDAKEAEQKREENKLELQKAFDASTFTFILYTFGAGTGGRISASAWANYHALQKAYRFTPTALCFVVNQVPQVEATEAERYKAEQVVAIERETGIPNPRVLFIEQTSKEAAQSSEAKKAIRSRLYNMLSHMVPAIHTQKEAVVMNEDLLQQAEQRYEQRDKEFTEAKEAFAQQSAAQATKMEELQTQVTNGQLTVQQQAEQMEAFKKEQTDKQNDLQQKLTAEQAKSKERDQPQPAPQPHGLFQTVGKVLDSILPF